MPKATIMRREKRTQFAGIFWHHQCSNRRNSKYDLRFL